MENTRISITPLNVQYSSRKQLSLLIKIKRILISTNHELEKYQCRKQFPLKNNYVDMSASAHFTTYATTISRQMELNNTKIDVIVFGFEGKDVNLLGIGCLDLGMLAQDDWTHGSVYKEFRLQLDKSEDPKAYITVSVNAQSNDTAALSRTKQVKSTTAEGSTLKTESYARQSLLIARRKKPDVPSAYEISRRNYKQVQITRVPQQKSRSKSKNASGSYKKRFEYQYSREVTREEDDSPQVPPTQRMVHKEDRGSPMPRIKTPEPITQFQYNKQALRLCRGDNRTTPTISKIKNNFLPKQNVRQNSRPSEFTQTEQMPKNMHKIIIDVQHSKRIPVESKQRCITYSYPARQDQQNEESQQQYEIEQRRKDTAKFQSVSPAKSKSPSPRSWGKQNKLNPSVHATQTQETSLIKQNKSKNISKQPEKKEQQEKDFTQSKKASANAVNKPNYQQYRHSRSFEQEPSPSSHREPIAKQKNTQAQNKTSISQSVILNASKEEDNKFRTIADKLQLIQQKIKSEKGSSPNQSASNRQNSNNKYGSIMEMQNEQGSSRKPQSPAIRKPKPKKQGEIVRIPQLDSANTFKQDHFESNFEGSPGQLPRSTDHIKSFNIDQSQDGKAEKTMQIKDNKKKDNNIKPNYGFKESQRSLETFGKGENSLDIKSSVQKYNPKSKNQKKQIVAIDEAIQTSIKKNNGKKDQNDIQNQFEYQIYPGVPEQPKLNKSSPLKLQIPHSSCDQKISSLEIQLDEQQQLHRRQTMEAELEHRKQMKQKQKEIKLLSDQVRNLNQKIQELMSVQNKSQESISSSKQDTDKLKDENTKLKNLIDKLNKELEESDEKHFELMTLGEKKDLEFKRKYESLLQKNQELLDILKEKEQLLRQKNEIISQVKSQSAQLVTAEPRKQSGQSQGKSYKQQYMTLKKKCVNLEAELKFRENDIRFLKIKNENLTQEKKDLENQIDNIAANNKFQMARKGSIAKINLETASLSNSIKVQNQVLKTEINGLRKQVQELTGIIEQAIAEGAVHQERMSSSRDSATKQNEKNLERRIQSLQQKNQALGQQLQQKQMKIAEIINLIFGTRNQKLMNEVEKLVGMEADR